MREAHKHIDFISKSCQSHSHYYV